MNIQAAKGTGAFQTPPDSNSQPLTDLVQWRQRVARTLPYVNPSLSFPQQLIAATNNLFFSSSDALSVYEPPSAKAIRQRLVALTKEYQIDVLHRDHKPVHSLAGCQKECLESAGFYFLSSGTDSATSAASRSNIVFFPCPDQILPLAHELARLCKHPDFSSEVRECKFASDNVFDSHPTPAIIYLKTSEPSQALLDYLDANLTPLPLEQESLLGAREIRPGFWHTQMLPHSHGCQPESRRHIVALSFLVRPEVDSDEEAVKLAARTLGYQPDAPDRLLEKTPAFESMLFFVKHSLVPAWEVVTGVSSMLDVLARLGILPGHEGAFNDPECQIALAELMQDKPVVVTKLDSSSRTVPSQWHRGFRVYRFGNGSETKSFPKACLQINVKADHLHTLLSLFPRSPLKQHLDPMPWKLIVEHSRAFAKIPAPIALQANCSMEKMREIANVIAEQLPASAFSYIDLYQKPHPPEWADIPGHERVAEGLSLSQCMSDKASQTHVFTHQINIIFNMLINRNRYNSAMPLEDMLAHYLFVNGYKMHDSSRTRPDLNIPEVSELLKTCQLDEGH